MEMNRLDRPREKMERMGASGLSDVELLALLIGSGSSRRGLHQIAGDLLKLVDEKGLGLTAEELAEIPGIGRSRCSRLLASIEFARRRLSPPHYRIRHPEDALPLLKPFADKKQEHFICISLNGAYEVLETRVVTIGLINRTLVHPREVYADPVAERAAAVVVAHNHPSGNVDPSPEDREITSRLRRAGDLLGIALLDHLIISREAHYSFLDHSRREQ